MLSRRVCNHNNIRKRALSPGNRCPLARHPADGEPRTPRRFENNAGKKYSKITHDARRVLLFDGLFLHTQRRTTTKTIIIIIILYGFMNFFFNFVF